MGEQSPESMSTPTGAVFLSYASQDAEAAQRICAALRSGGVEVWFDQSELRGGDAWDRQIRERIHDCRLFIALISAHTEARDEGYFRHEWKLAVERTHHMSDKKPFLVPVVIDDTRERGASVPDKLHEVQWTRLPGGKTPPDFVARISALLHAEPGPTNPPRFDSSSSESRAKAQKRRMLWPWLGLGALLSALAFGAISWRYALTRPAAGRATGVTARVTESSIAVLPFVDLSEKRDQEYFADGLAEEIVDLLAKIPGLKIIGRTSSFQFKSNSGDLRKIGSALGASYIVEGSVRKLGDRVRVTVQLIDARDGTHRWSETYDRDSTNILTLQRQIATAVCRELQVSVSDYFGAGAPTKSAEAYDLYLRAIRDVDTYNREAVLRAITAFSTAVEYDPGYANAWVGLADAYDVAATTRYLPHAEAYRQARLAADKALSLDPMNAGAYATRAFVRMNLWDWQGGEQDIARSLEIRKTSGGLQAAANLALARGDLAEGERLFLEVLALDPLDPLTVAALAYSVYPSLGRYDDADRFYLKLKDLDAHFAWFSAYRSLVEVQEGHYPAALQVAETETDPEAKETALAVAYFALGKSDQSNQALGRLLRIPTSEYSAGVVYAYRGEKDLAFQSLEAALQAKRPDLTNLKADPMLTALRADERFKELLRRMNLPE